MFDQLSKIIIEKQPKQLRVSYQVYRDLCIEMNKNMTDKKEEVFINDVHVARDRSYHEVVYVLTWLGAKADEINELK